MHNLQQKDKVNISISENILVGCQGMKNILDLALVKQQGNYAHYPFTMWPMTLSVLKRPLVPLTYYQTTTF